MARDLAPDWILQETLAIQAQTAQWFKDKQAENAGQKPLTLTVLGCGDLGTAILSGIFDSLSPSETPDPSKATAPTDPTVPAKLPARFSACVTRPESGKRIQKELEKHEIKVTIHENNNLQAVQDADIIILGCKPHVAECIIGNDDMRAALQNKLLISILAGVTEIELRDMVYPKGTTVPSFGACKIVRAMPNMAAAVRESMTVISTSDPPLPEEANKMVTWIFTRIGRVVHLPPANMDACTALCGSGPGFVSIMLESMVAGAIAMGVPKEEAYIMAAQTMRGTTGMVLQGGEHPAMIRDKVSTPGGCTISGMLVLEEGAIRGTISRAVREATAVAAQLGEGKQNVNQSTRVTMNILQLIQTTPCELTGTNSASERELDAMDHPIFAQLDRLQRGARETRPPRPAYHEQHASHGREVYSQDPEYYDGEEVYEDENAFPPTANDPYTDAYSQYEEEPPMRGPQMLPPQGDMRPYRSQVPQAREPIASGRLDVSQYAYGSAHTGASSSSSYNLPSSPVANAGRRRFAATDQAIRRQPMQPARYNQPQYDQVDDSTAFDTNIDDDDFGEVLQLQAFARPTAPPARQQQPKAPARDTPVVQGITLISTQTLPDRFRSIFSFPLFNAVQSKCFPVVYNTNDNFVLSAPTGSGKTAVLELAVLRLMNGFANGSYKIVYQAPTKSLCSERQRDWQQKFGRFDLQVAELTGDTDHAQLRNVQYASIIITTPERWDSMTRKWKDHQKLMQMVKLFLIDEVHILKEERGATLEAIVSRMKSVGSDIRFVALSATVPNSQDIATWLGKDSVTPYIPAPRERFGEEFRPVPLSKHVCGYNAPGNDFAFEKMLNAKLPEVIAKWSQRKPIMVFCFTRNSCVDTAKLLANWWASKGPRDRYWEAPTKRVLVEDKELRDTVPSGVAYHHAGLSANDRTAVEKAYLEGDVNVICCTSTLAVGVNLPCHMVIIKNTVAYQSNGGSGGCKEYSDLEVMQMLGRAGRPQFDRSAVAIILTRLQKRDHYEKMVTGQEVLESCLHSNLIDHLNAEIGLGTITSASTAKRWLSGTFLYVRLKENPEHYKLDGGASGRNLEERLEAICNKAIALLQEHDLVQGAAKLQCTEFGDAMARYYLQFDTMKVLLALPPRAKTSEILSAIAQATEFSDIRFRGGEKTTYKSLNQNSSIKFPIPVNLDAPAQKISLIIQAVLGAIGFPSEDHKQRLDFSTAKSLIFSNVQRLIRCVVDCQLYLQDSVTARNALELARSLGAQVWDDSPLHMKQLEGVGIVTVRKLATAGLKTVDDIETTEQHRLEHLLSRNPPFGMQLQEKAKGFPKLRVGMKAVGEPIIRTGEPVTVRVRTDIGFLNDKTPEFFQKRPVYVCLLTERSDGHLLHFARISAKKLNKGQEVMFEAKLTSPSQTVRAYVMCDTIAGTMRTAILKPDVPLQAFPAPKAVEKDTQKPTANTKVARKRSGVGSKRKASDTAFDEFGDDAIDDADMALAENGGFENIDDFDDDARPTAKKTNKRQKQSSINDFVAPDHEPRQLENGKWACNHACKDKTSCKHLCCREGLDKKPKAPKPKTNKKDSDSTMDPKQTQLNMSVSKKTQEAATSLQAQSLRSGPPLSRNPSKGAEIHNLNTLHSNTKSNTRPVPLLSSTSSAPKKSSSVPAPPSLRGPRWKISEATRRAEQELISDDFGDLDDLSTFDELVADRPSARMSPPPQQGSEQFGLDNEDEDMLDDFPSADKDEPGGHSKLHVQDSSYDFDDDALEPEPVKKGPAEPQPPVLPIKHDPIVKPAGPFVEVPSDSAAFDLGCKAPGAKHLNVRGNDTGKLGVISSDRPSALLERASATGGHSMLIGDGISSDTQVAHGRIPAAAGGGTEQPESDDAATKQFMEVFGCDLFNLVD